MLFCVFAVRLQQSQVVLSRELIFFLLRSLALFTIHMDFVMCLLKRIRCVNASERIIC